jgi:hypothetical protein
MQINRENLKKSRGWILKYILIVVAVIAAPLIGKGIAPLFDHVALTWGGKAELRGLFAELTTTLIWLVGMIVVFLVEKKRKSTQETAEPIVLEEVAVTEAKQFPKKKKKEKTPILPLQNVGAIFLIVVTCLVLVTLQIGFNVKPFYDLGEKMTFSDLVNKIGELCQNFVRAAMIVTALHCAYRFFEILFENAGEKYREWMLWLGTGFFVLCIGIIDVLISGHALAWTYLFFYAAFTAIFYFTKKHFIKSYLLILFIYIF